MGELILCYSRIAAMPFYIENASLNIYSIEELCYYLEKYPDRLEEAFFSPELCLWLEQELALKELADELRECRKSGAMLADMAAKVLHAAGYLAEKERSRLLGQLKELEGKDDFERGRIRADRCVKNHRYAEGILEYRELLKMAEQKETGAADVGSIWHNMGVACANMFLYEQAMECFEKAYEYNNQPESLIEMYLARQCVLSEEMDEFSPPEEWRAQVMERLQQAADGLEEFSPELKQEELEVWKKRYRLYSQL